MDRRRRAARTVALMSLFTMTDTQTDVPIASFDGDGSDLISLIVGIDPVQAGSGDPSPDNVRPISGWTGANIHVSPTTDVDDGTTYSITFPTEAGTVYGGTLDAVNGTMTVDRRFITIDGNSAIGKESTGWSPNYEAFYLNISDYPGRNVPVNVVPNILSNQLKAETYTYLRSGAANPFSVSFTAGATYVEWLSTSATVAEEKARITNAPIQVAYELATPIVYDLTPTQVTTLIGTNNIWADTGDIKYIEYNI